MRRVILSANVTLDGFACGPNGELDWHFRNWNDEMEECVFDQIRTVDTILVGRVMYEAMANYWPRIADDPSSRRKDIEFAGWMNSQLKIVFTSKLSQTIWNNSTIASAGPVDELEWLRKMPGKDMIMWGGGSLVQSFIKEGLIDEFNLWVSPVLLGKGKRLFDDAGQLDLSLTSTRKFANGVLLTTYVPNESILSWKQ